MTHVGFHASNESVDVEDFESEGVTRVTLCNPDDIEVGKTYTIYSDENHTRLVLWDEDENYTVFPWERVVKVRRESV